MYRKSKYKQLNNKEWLKENYMTKRYTLTKIADIIGCTPWSVRNALIKFGFQTRTTGEARTGEKRLSKYVLLNDEKWLRQKYLNEKISWNKIAKIVGTKSELSAKQALNRFNIPLRPPMRHVKHGVSLAYPLLNDKEWLYDQYINQKKSTIDISKEVGCIAAQTVCQALRRHNINVRTKSEGHLIDREGDGLILNKTNLSIIAGCLLGDASFSRSHKTGNPCFRKTNIYYDHILFVAKQLFGDKWQSRVRGPITQKGGFKQYKSSPFFALSSLVHPELMDSCNKWYPISNNRKKIVPNDIPINPIVLLHWFLDDGYSYKVKRKYSNPKWNKTKVRICFCTQSFNPEELNVLCKRIYNIVGIKAKPRFHQRHGKVSGTGYEVHLPETEDARKKFFDYIGPCPVPSMAYKWK